MNGCEPNEVPLRTLGPGACFELLLATTKKRGVVLEHLTGSTLVDLNEGAAHYCLDCPVVPHPEARCEEWLAKEERAMAAKKNGTKKVKAEKKITVTLYERTSKDAKRFEEKENDSRAAIVYRAVLKHGPASLDEIFEKVEKDFSVNFRGKKDNIKGNVRTFLRNFAEEGLVKTSEAEVAKSAAA